MKKTLIALGLSVAFIVPAVAGPCTDQLTSVSKALTSAKLDDNKRAMIEDLLKLAMQKQTSGDKTGCVADLSEAKKILKIK